MLKRTLALLVCIVFFSQIIALEKINVVFATGEWEPFTSETMPNKGIATEFIEAICKEVNIIPKFEFYPWSRAEMYVKNGTVFAAFPYAITEQRKQDFDFSDIIFYGINSFFYLDSNKKITEKMNNYKDLDDFKDFSFGVVRGNFVESELKRKV